MAKWLTLLLACGAYANDKCFTGKTGPGFTSAPVLSTQPVDTKVSYHMYDDGHTLPVSCQAYVNQIQNSKYVTAFLGTNGQSCGGYGCGTCIKVTNKWEPNKTPLYLTIVDTGGNFFDINNEAFDELFGNEGYQRGCGEATVQVVSTAFCQASHQGQKNELGSYGNCRCPDVDNTFKPKSGAGHYWKCPNNDWTGALPGPPAPPPDCSQVTCNSPPDIQCYETAGTCNSATGTCSYSQMQNGISCDDGDSTTTDDKCANGVCQGTPASSGSGSGGDSSGACRCAGTAKAKSQNPAVDWDGSYCVSPNRCQLGVEPDFCAWTGDCSNSGGSSSGGSSSGGSSGSTCAQTKRCGSSWGDANGKCGTACPSATDAECTGGEKCYGGLTNPGTGGAAEAAQQDDNNSAMPLGGVIAISVCVTVAVMSVMFAAVYLLVLKKRNASQSNAYVKMAGANDGADEQQL